MISLLDAGGSLAEAGLLALTNLVIDDALRQRLAQDDSFARIFAFAHYWSKPILDGVFKEQDERNQAARLYSLLGRSLFCMRRRHCYTVVAGFLLLNFDSFMYRAASLV